MRSMVEGQALAGRTQSGPLHPPLKERAVPLPVPGRI